jgi:hypothetical protein
MARPVDLQLRRTQLSLTKAVDAIDEAQRQFGALKRLLATAGFTLDDPSRPGDPRGIHVIEADRQPDGTVLVSLDHGPKMRLSATAAMVLLLMAGNSSENSEDDFVSWKTAEQIRERLSVKYSISLSGGALRMAIHRLRRTLEAHGYPKWLVHSRRPASYRLALWRREERERAVLRV